LFLNSLPGPLRTTSLVSFALDDFFFALAKDRFFIFSLLYPSFPLLLLISAFSYIPLRADEKLLIGRNLVFFFFSACFFVTFSLLDPSSLFLILLGRVLRVPLCDPHFQNLLRLP